MGVFRKAGLAPWQQKVVQEKVQLDIKRQALADFLNGHEAAGLTEEGRQLLLDQQKHMANYSHVLGDRIARFEDE